MEDFLLFALVGFLAQIVDGALGMAYGVISSTVLLSLGVPPATASASVHAAEVFTTAASAGSHAVNRNVNWELFAPLAAGGRMPGRRAWGFRAHLGQRRGHEALHRRLSRSHGPSDPVPRPGGRPKSGPFPRGIPGPWA